MSKKQREAFEAGIAWADSNPENYEGKTESLRRYPDSPAKCVREIVVEWLKANGCDGLFNREYKCCCTEVLIEHDGRKCISIASTFADCRPGVLVDGKIVEREG
jgi:hypothetical protein